MISTAREKQILVAGLAMAACIVYLLLFGAATSDRRDRNVAAQQEAATQSAAKATASNVSPIVREIADYNPTTIELLKLQSGDLEIGRLNIYIDPETRCQYLRPVYREGLTPRLRKDGRPWCD